MTKGRTLIVGDVHGCATELDELLTAARFAQGVDRLVLVGDLVARGPDSARVVEQMVSLGARAVRGNHDERVLTWWRVAEEFGRREASRRVKLSERHKEVVRQFKPRHFESLEALPLMLSLPEHEVMVVHAGVDPARPLPTNDEDTLLTVRSVDAAGKASRRLTGTPWASLWRGPQHLVFGHDARRNLQLEPFATGLDTGCCYGRQLSALVLDAGEPVSHDPDARRRQLVQVQARQAWCPMGSADGSE